MPTNYMKTISDGTNDIYLRASGSYDPVANTSANNGNALVKITENASGVPLYGTNEIILSNSTKLPQTVPTSADKGKVPTVQNDGTVAWGNGGHELLDTVAKVEAITSASDDHVVSAYVIKNYSNRYTDSIIATLTANNNQVVVTDNLLKNNNATYEFMFEPTLNASSEYEVMTLSKYTLDTTSGTLTLDVVEAPTVNTRIRIDISTYRA